MPEKGRGGKKRKLRRKQGGDGRQEKEGGASYVHELWLGDGGLREEREKGDDAHATNAQRNIQCGGVTSASVARKEGGRREQRPKEQH